MKKLLWIIPLVIVVAILAFVMYLNLALPNVGPAPDLKVEITSERVIRGKYLANHVMSCVDCHSKRDFSKYAAPVKGTPFAGGGEEFTIETGAPGNFYAPNLTPYHLKDWTDGEIYRAVTAGVSKDGHPLFPAMPYHLYGQASKEDIYSIIAYLRTLPSYESTVPKSKAKFPFSLILRTIPQKIENKEIPDQNNILAYGKYMTTIAACVDCHTQMEKGKYMMDKAFAGNNEFILPNGIVRTANITPDKETGIGSWTEEMFVNRFKIYSDSDFVPQEVGNGFNTVMPWILYSGMNDYDLKAIYTYLHSLKPIKNQVVKFTPKN